MTVTAPNLGGFGRETANDTRGAQSIWRSDRFGIRDDDESPPNGYLFIYSISFAILTSVAYLRALTSPKNTHGPDKASRPFPSRGGNFFFMSKAVRVISLVSSAAVLLSKHRYGRSPCSPRTLVVRGNAVRRRTNV